MYDKVRAYGNVLKSNGGTMTPKEIITDLMEPIELLRLKRNLYLNNVKALEQPENTRACLNIIQSCNTEQELVYYTLVYIKLRNPIANETIDNIIRGM